MDIFPCLECTRKLLDHSMPYHVFCAIIEHAIQVNFNIHGITNKKVITNKMKLWLNGNVIKWSCDQSSYGQQIYVPALNYESNWNNLYWEMHVWCQILDDMQQTSKEQRQNGSNSDSHSTNISISCLTSNFKYQWHSYWI